SGIIEAVDEGFTQQSPDGLSIPSGLYEPALIEAFKNYLRVLTTLNVETPVFVFLSLVGVKGYTMATNTLVFRNERRRDHYLIDRDCLLLPEIIIEDYASNIENLMKNCFDSLWNACGYSSSPHYNEEGKWELK
ncbi:MAG: hypothetical protein Q8M92_02660, partial [Candidatus Subteraquimicrobiales bacterium]|nr:hypothetical protein [Candidatus Subteraquimicrobiales bacterium]